MQSKEHLCLRTSPLGICVAHVKFVKNIYHALGNKRFLSLTETSAKLQLLCEGSRKLLENPNTFKEFRRNLSRVFYERLGLTAEGGGEVNVTKDNCCCARHAV